MAAALGHVGQARDLVPAAHHPGQLDVRDRLGHGVGGRGQAARQGGDGGQDHEEALQHAERYLCVVTT